MTLAVSIAQGGSNNVTMRNRIINGAMMIDQRNAGASVSNLAGSSSLYFLDRWQLYCANNSTANASVQQSTTAPAGFTNSLLVTVTAAQASLGATFYSMIWQRIEGYNIANLNWGTANAQSVTLSFQVRSSVTGTFGGTVLNSAQNRVYPYTYTINSADTWETKTIVIPGDTTGTWATGNTAGIIVGFGLGVGSTYGSGTPGAWSATASYSASGATNLYATNGATFYITGVQLEAGTTATPFEQRLYGTELALCQRYYYKNQATGTASYFGGGYDYTTTNAIFNIQFPVPMRTSPSALETTGTASDYRVLTGTLGSATCTALAFNNAQTISASMTATVASGLTAGQGAFLLANGSANAYLGWSAEL